MRLHVVDGLEPSMRQRRELVPPGVKDVGVVGHVDDQAWSIGAVRQQVAVLGLLALRQPGLPRHRGVHLLKEGIVARVLSNPTDHPLRYCLG